MTGTSIRGPITAAKAAPELIPKTATATAMASSKLLLAAVKARVVAPERGARFDREDSREELGKKEESQGNIKGSALKLEFSVDDGLDKPG